MIQQLNQLIRQSNMIKNDVNTSSHIDKTVPIQQTNNITIIKLNK